MARDREVDNAYGKDAQVMAIRAARRYWGDKLVRTAKPHRLLDPEAGPLIAVRLSVLTRKTLGGLETDLQSRVLTVHGQPVPGLYAAGEAAGFGGGGMHGYRSLEGTFLGGCSSAAAPPAVQPVPELRQVSAFVQLSRRARPVRRRPQGGRNKPALT